ncbi:hypothetical protein CesoFtcFv8_006197 [Champsocephalus esox]|uniref:Uncharacterized protein n=1 Tax=Champsocephalus esox TaxID=159716 RepID=A0AAN8CIX1_9TELE|nr:hypothetical protein CesoFtcFv8_006197 [Champsocephalus esox]
MFISTFGGASCVLFRCLCISRPAACISSRGSLPSSSPMRSSFQVQHSSINLIHSLTELRDRASRLCSTDNRCPTTSAAHPPVVLLCLGPSLLLLPPVCTFLRRFIQESDRPMSC